MRRALVLLFALAVALGSASVVSARPSTSSITLHPGQSKKVGRYTVVCTTQKLTKRPGRIVLHPGFQVKVGSVRVRCARASAPKPTPTPTTPTPTPTPPPPPPPPAGTARSNPYPLGTANNAGDWRVAVASVTPDATAAVLAENQFNSPPVAGRQFFIITLNYTFAGAGTGTPWLSLSSLRVVGSRNVLYTSFDGDDRCGVIPNDMDDHPDLLAGGSDTANMCFSVPSDEVASLELVWSAGSTLGPWWALH